MRSERRLDGIDRAILAILQEEGRIPNQDLADRVGLSPSPCLRRVRRLEDDGYIDRYVALVDPDRVERGLDVFVQVRLERQNLDAVERFESAVVELPEVQSCFRMVGDIDFLLHLVLTDLTGWDEFYMRHLGEIDGVAGLTSMIAMRRVKYTTAVPV
ncbi:MAG: Lrp/AsnC family transcriptional regulator [Acidimicrobiia bacterium]|nr:Lrp/AsnC family transcriptional regulator [Acidimicrobiia bacterium]